MLFFYDHIGNRNHIIPNISLVRGRHMGHYSDFMRRYIVFNFEA